METSMDRRGFLKGMAATGIAACAGASLASCAPASPKANDESSETTSTKIERKEGAQTKECDVVIVGAGAAGLMAALKLARAGKQVIVLEKAESVGMSNFAMCGGPTACETKLQEQENAPVSLDTIFSYMYDFSRTSVNGKLLRNSLAHTGEAINAMLDLGIPMTLIPDTYGVGFRGRHMFNVGGMDRVQPVADAVIEAGGEILTKTAGEKIIMENGVAKGVQTDADLDIMAKAVLVSTGGFLGNEKMQREHFNTPVYALGNVLSDGGGINMVLDAGGRLDRNFAVLGNECGAVSKATQGSPFTEDWHNVNEHYGYWLFGGLYVDPAGDRFIAEDRIAQFPLAIGGEAILRTGKAYIVMDDDYYQACQNGGIYSYLGQPVEWVSGPVADYYAPTKANAEAHLSQAIEEGWAAKAETIEELAEKFNLLNLEKTVEEYNEFCATGVDADFNKSASFLKPVAKAPFYIFEYVPSAWGTNGGVKVDANLRALDGENKAIEGLYVAGVDQGSVYSVPYYTNEGSSVGLALGSGAFAADVISDFIQ